MKIAKLKYEKIETESQEWNMPTEPMYFFENHIRRVISVVPKWTTWNKKTYKKQEEIYELSIICVYQSFELKIEAYSIQVSRINDLYNSKNDHEGPISLIQFLIDSCIPYEILDKETNKIKKGIYCQRTKEQFESDFHGCIQRIIEKGTKDLKSFAKKTKKV